MGNEWLVVMGVVERNDPARTGVTVGRVVGLLAAILVVVSFIDAREEYFRGLSLAFELFGLEPGLSVTVLFWGNALAAAVAYYAASYVLGSLIGVVYDWLDRDSIVVVLALALVVGIGVGGYSAIESGSVWIGVGHLLVWLCYVPLFQRWYDPDEGHDRSQPVRLS